MDNNTVALGLIQIPRKLAESYSTKRVTLCSTFGCTTDKSLLAVGLKGVIRCSQQVATEMTIKGDTIWTNLTFVTTQNALLLTIEGISYTVTKRNNTFILRLRCQVQHRI